MLDRFEEKHGGYEEILDNYLIWACRVNKHNNKAKREADRYQQLLRKHDKLIWLVMGYNEGIKAVKEGKVS